MLIIIAALALSGGGTYPVQGSVKTTQEIAEEQSALASLNRLHFACHVKYMCTLAPYPAGDIPLYIVGMDANLASYLEQHGYTDSWKVTGDPYGESARTIGHKEGEETKTREYVEKTSAGSLSGLRVPLIYAPVGIEASEKSAGRWPITITWTLTGPSGKVVRSLSYNLILMECSGQEEETTSEDYCKKVIHYVGELQNTGTASQGIEAFSE